MTNLLRSMAGLVLLVALGAAAAPSRYAVGQVWEYHARPGDEGSLLKIQSIEDEPAYNAGPIYHISVIGFHVRNPQMAPILAHAPVNRAVLDASVTRLSDSKAEFPDAAPGIAQWRAAKGGVFTIPVARIIEILDAQTAAPAESAPPVA
jgi:hypothetical protein